MEQAEEGVVVKLDLSRVKKHGYWVKEMSSAQKRLRKFQKQGNQVVDRYLDEGANIDGMDSSPGRQRLNLFHKNIATLLDMMYGQAPKIDVTREHYDPDDDVARVSALLLQRLLQADVAPSGADLNSVYKAILQDRLLPGLGQARVRYDFTTEEVTTGVIDPDTMEVMTTEQLVDEEAPIDYVHWQDFVWGWCRTWAECPWVGFRAWLDKDEMEERFGPEVANAAEYRNQKPAEGLDSMGSNSEEDRERTQKAEVWEIWCKDDRKVYWLVKGYDKCADIKDDPLGLEGFFPCPRPLIANCTTKLFVPKADFVFAQDLYNEIDILQGRISTITRAIKVVGVYDKAAGDSVGRMLKEGHENDLIPVDNWAMFAEKGQLQGVIDWFPVQEVVNTLQVLTQIQQNKIEQLYEVTGLSDIMRGANTDQYTAARTQAQKAKMGSISIQAMQDEFARFASDLEGLKAEVVAKHFAPQTIAKHANAQFVPKADQQLVGPALQLIKTPGLRWRINIKPESMSMIDYAQLKSERSEFLMSMAQYIQSASSAVQAVPNSMPILLELMKWAMAGFKGAEYLEGTMDQAIQMASQMPPPGQEDQGPSPEEIKMQTEQLKAQAAQQKAQMELQKLQLKSQADLASIQAKLQGEIQKIQVDAERDAALEDQRSQYALLEIAEELQSKLAEIEANFESTVGVERTQASLDMTVDDNAHRNRLREIAAQGRGNANSAQ